MVRRTQVMDHGWISWIEMALRSVAVAATNTNRG